MTIETFYDQSLGKLSGGAWIPTGMFWICSEACYGVWHFVIAALIQ